MYIAPATMTPPQTGAAVLIAPLGLVVDVATAPALVACDLTLLRPALTSLLIELMADKALLFAAPVAVAATLERDDAALAASFVAVEKAPTAIEVPELMAPAPSD